ncbi:hypothetical protein [Ekhidna sp.]|uniref:hypothetical protein n=1 Tax=Ekhidna sp. TaxID=2608089 RepID=UPI003298D2DD
MRIRVLFLLSIIIFSAAPKERFFYSQQVVATIEDGRLIEASGIEESYLNPGYFWTHNDSGSEPILYLINDKAQIIMEVDLQGVNNRDWEEIVTAKQGDDAFIYVGEIGDNKAVHEDVKIFRLPEPIFEGKRKITIDISKIDIMSFTYAEGARDAEAVLYDHTQKEFVLVTKREDNALVYAFPFEPNKEAVAIKSKGTIPAKLFTAADMNEQGEILLKHYGAIYYWGPSNQSAVDRILAWDAIMVDYIPEPQGEAICWSNGDFYTISEKNIGKPQEMLFFKRMR